MRKLRALLAEDDQAEAAAKPTGAGCAELRRIPHERSALR